MASPRSLVSFLLGLAVLAGGGCVLAAGPPPEPRYKLVLQTPPSGSLSAITPSPDGTLVATGGEGGIRLYDAKTGDLVRAIGELCDRSIVFTPDSKQLTAAGFHMDRLVPFFDVHTGKRVRSLPGHTEWEVDACAISPDGTLLASTGTDLQLLVWDLTTGTIRHKLAGQPYRLTTLAFSPDGATLASGGREIRLWDMKTGKVRQTLRGQRDWVCTVAFSPGGRTLASGSCDWSFHRGHDWPRPAIRGPERCEWRLWDLATGEPKRVVSDAGPLLALAFSPDGKALACGVGNEVRLYEIGSEAPGRVLTTHNHGVTSVAFTPDGAAVLSASHDQTARRTNASTGKPDWEAPGLHDQVNAVALSADGSVLITGSSDARFAIGWSKAGERGLGAGAVRVWDAHTGRLLRRLDQGADQIMAAAISPDAARVAAGGASPDGKGVVHLWNTQGGAAIWSTHDQAAEVLAVAFAPDGALVATADASGSVLLRDPTTGGVARTLSGHARGATSLAFSADGQTLACGAGDGTTILWQVRTGKRLRAFRPEDSRASALTGDRPVTSVALTRDGGSLVTCTAGVNLTLAEAVRFWDVRTGSLKRALPIPPTTGRPMAVSPDGSIVATGGKSVCLWNAETGKPLRELFGHLKRTQAITFSADGRLVISGGSYGTTNVWETATGRHLVTLFAFPPTPGTHDESWLAYHPEGFYAGSPDVARFLAWRVGMDLLTPRDLGAELHKPERIAEGLNR